MGALVRPSLLSVILRQLPGPLLRVLDRWSQRIARRRREERQRRWQSRQAIAARHD